MQKLGSTAEKGFWKDEPYPALSDTLYYEGQKALLSQHTIIDEREKVSVFRFWNQTFTNTELGKIVSSIGFSAVEYFERIIPGCEMCRSEDVTFCLAGK